MKRYAREAVDPFKTSSVAEVFKAFVTSEREVQKGGRP
jgi:hypothetical protein